MCGLTRKLCEILLHFEIPLGITAPRAFFLTLPHCPGPGAFTPFFRDQFISRLREIPLYRCPRLSFLGPEMV